MFKIKPEYDFVENEKAMLKLWDEKQSFKRLLKKNENGKKYRFLDGPITANNPMGMHHVWGRTLKDTFLRYKAMQGYTSHYRNGFDGQGLWVEVEVEKELGFTSKKDIEAFGLDKFTEACVARVKKYAGIITEQSKRLGQWMDWDNSYYTHLDSNITSIWAMLKKCHEYGWLKQLYRPLPWCGRCGTSLSEHEMAGSYKELEHMAVFVKLPLVGENANILVWTTTPWTLSSNTALAVRPDLTYLSVELPGEEKPLIMVKELYFNKFHKDGGKILAEFKGGDLAGKRYETMFPDLPRQRDVEHKIVLWDEVSADEGSGVVHIAPGCGAEDYDLGLKENLAVIMPIDENGYFYDDFGFLSGKHAQEVSELVFEKLREQGKLFLVHKHKHSYPVCWRCKKEILFRLGKEWAIAVDEIRPKLIENARKVKWFPEYQGRRMEDWLNNMSDWNISRKRFYGLPLPFYPCSCGHLTVIGSKEELREKAVDPTLVNNIKELHRPWIDEIKIKCEKCGREVTRIAEVGDVWLDAGIVPFSTLKYFEDRDYWRSYFPAEYVIEMHEQVRLWFYSLLFMSTVLTGEPPYERVGTHGIVVSEDGSRFSKTGVMIRFEEAAEKIGADASRYIYVSTPATSEVRFGFSLGEDAKRRLLSFWNIVVFFDLYYQLDKPVLDHEPVLTDKSDRWLASRVNKFIATAQAAYEDYEPWEIIKLFEKCVDDVSNWYIRINRKRFWKSEMNDDKYAAYHVLYRAIKAMTQVMAPIIPFMTEWIWQALVLNVEPKEEHSVHLTSFPVAGAIDEEILAETEVAREVITGALKLRNEKSLKIKQPLSALYLCGYDEKLVSSYAETIANEINVKEINFLTGKDALRRRYLSLDFRKAGPVLKDKVNAVKELLAGLDHEAMAELVRQYDEIETVTLDEYALPKEVLKVEAEYLPGYAWFEDGEKLVALATELTPELIAEGYYRELLRQCQVLRKEAGFQVSDRIELAVICESEEMRKVLAAYGSQLGEETLSTVLPDIASPRLEKTIAIDEMEVTVKMK
ncbi:MAG TPA: isoleucine--tRNA ligase [Acholeplasmataceae bacterium]|jgi:isoleucyl-tRNA synthetase|nr:isoleucine--tRNA ligase [Acholeplasmataceae bacterium]